MLFWILLALLTAGAVLAVLLPLGRVRPHAADPGSRDRAVYRDQLAELERDRAEGKIGGPEAEAARVEIARRLIAADRREDAGLNPGALVWRRRAAAGLALIGVPAVALGLYLPLGAPELGGQPLQARLATPAGQQNLPQMIARIEDHLARQPEDGRGWEVLAPVYMRLDRFQDSARAWNNAVRLLGSTAERESGLGEALVAAEGGIVTAEARQAFERALVAEPGAAKPRFYLALAKQQQGDVAAAVEDWRTLLAEAPADAAWREVVEQAIAQAAPRAERQGGEGKGPTPGDVAAAAALPAADRQTMIDEMVSRLAARLERQPDDAAGWLRLIRAYSVLGRNAEAAEAAGRALRSVSQQDERKQIELLVADLGLTVDQAGAP